VRLDHLLSRRAEGCLTSRDKQPSTPQPDDRPVDEKVSPGVGEQLCNELLPLTSQLLSNWNKKYLHLKNRIECKTHEKIVSRKGLSSPQHVEKLLRAHGGCLGAKCRRRTWDTAKSLGKPCTGVDPGISEWGNPPLRTNGISLLNT
jgi:hypothetical protein